MPNTGVISAIVYLQKGHRHSCQSGVVFLDLYLHVQVGPLDLHVQVDPLGQHHEVVGPLFLHDAVGPGPSVLWGEWVEVATLYTLY